MLEPRACARAFGMGLDVESSRRVSGASPWCFGSSLEWVLVFEQNNYSTSVWVESRGRCHTLGGNVAGTNMVMGLGWG